MKKLSLALAALALCGAANAAVVNANFAVTVNFTSACQVSATNPTTLAFPAYTAFGTAVSLTPATFSFECSRGAGAVATFAMGGGVGSSSTVANTGYFSTAGLNYFLTISASTNAPGTAATAANNAIGGPDVVSVNVGGTIPQQAGITNSAIAAVDTDNRVLIITF